MLAGVLLLVTLLVGIAAGVAIERWAFRPERRVQVRDAQVREALARGVSESRAPRLDPVEFRERYTRQLARQLDLTPEQRAVADSLLRLQQQESRAAMRDLRPRLDSINRQTEAELRKVLTAEQLERWQKLREAREVRR
jgi:hypothetical protein